MNEFMEYYEIALYVVLFTGVCSFICFIIVFFLNEWPLTEMSIMDYLELFGAALAAAIMISLLMGLILTLNWLATLGLEWLGIDPADLPVSDLY